MRKTITIFVVVLALLITISTIPQTRMYKETIEKGDTTTQEYVELREMALEYAKTLQFEETDEIEIESKIKDGFMIVKIDKDYRCCMVATYPISKMEDGSWKIDCENGLYETLEIIYFTYILILCRSVNLYVLSYISLYWALESIVKKFKEIKKEVIKLKNELEEELKDD